MIKKITLITFITMFVAGFLQNTSYAEPENDLDDIREKRDNIKDDLSEKEERSKSLISDIKKLNKDVHRGNKAIEEKEKEIESTKENIAETIKFVHSLQDDIDDLEEGIEDRYNILKERLASYQKSGGRISYLDVIFGANDFNDFTSRVSLVTKITDSDETLMNQLKKDTKAVEKKQALTWDKLDELNGVKDKQENALASIDDERQENETRLVTLGDKQEELSASRDELQLEDSELASLEKETKDSITAAAEAKEKAEREAKAKAREKEEREQQEKEKRIREKENNETEKDDETENNTEQPDSDKKKDNETDNDGDKDESEDEDKGTDDDKKSFTVNSTAYTVESAGGNGVTAIGIDLKKNPNKKVIAVDPSVIPLRSIVWVEGYGYAIAGDTGGAINGKKIDVFVPTQEKAYAWGVRRVKVEIQ